MKKLSWFFLVLFISVACQSSSGETSPEISNPNTVEQESEPIFLPKREGYIYLNLPFELKGNNTLEEKSKLAAAAGFKKGVQAIFVTSDNIEVVLTCSEMNNAKIEFQTSVLNKDGQQVGELVDVIYHGQRADSETEYSFNSGIKITNQEILWECNFAKESSFGNSQETWTKHLLITKEGIIEATEKPILDGFVELKNSLIFTGAEGPNKTVEKLGSMGLEILTMGTPDPQKGLAKAANGTLVALAASESMSMGNYELTFYVVDGSGNKIGEDYSTFIYSATSTGYVNADVSIQENSLMIRSKEYKGKTMLSEKTVTYKITPKGLVE